MRLSVGFLLLALSPAGVAQTSVAAGAAEALQLSPAAAYEEAMHPLDLTRHSFSNWSDTEMAALGVTIDKARAGCAARDSKSYSGADLIDLARLCSLGMSYPAVVQATLRYIGMDGAKPQLTQAYASLVDALLRMKDEHDALTYAQTMLDTVPYDALTAETVGSAISFMQFVYTPDALLLAKKREPLLLERLRAAAATATAEVVHGGEPPQAIHELYADGLALAALEQLSREPAADVAAAVAALDEALPATLGPDDSIPIGVMRRRYALLGKALPEMESTPQAGGSKSVALLHTLDFPDRLPMLPAVNAITGLLLFPDWCAQCIRMTLKLPQSVFTVKGHEAYMYGLLLPTVAQTPAPAARTKVQAVAAPVPFAPADASNMLRSTATLVGDASLLDRFAVTDIPMLVLTDSEGIVRVLQPVSDDATEPGGTIDAAIAKVGDMWPNPRLVAPKPVAGKP